MRLGQPSHWHRLARVVLRGQREHRDTGIIDFGRNTQNIASGTRALSEMDFRVVDEATVPNGPSIPGTRLTSSTTIEP